MKCEIIHFNISERSIFEEHLNEMAKLGWHIHHITKYFICYKKEEKDVTYLVDLSSKIDARQQEMYEEFGCELICETKIFKIFQTKNRNSYSHTDFIVEREVIQKKEKSWFKEEILYPLILFAIYSYNNLMLNNILIYLSTNGPLLILIALLLLILEKVLELVLKPKVNTIESIKIKTKLRFVCTFVSFVISTMGVYMMSNLQFSLIYIISFIVLLLSTNDSRKFKQNDSKKLINTIIVALCYLSLGLSGFKDMLKGENPQLINNNLIAEEIKFRTGIDNASIFLEYKTATFDTSKGKFKYIYIKPKFNFIEEIIEKDRIEQFNNSYSIDNIDVYSNKSGSNVMLVNHNEYIELNTNYYEVRKEFLKEVINELDW